MLHVDGLNGPHKQLLLLEDASSLLSLVFGIGHHNHNHEVPTKPVSTHNSGLFIYLFYITGPL